MIKSFVLHYEEGLPRTTAQQKGERIAYGRNGAAYIQHYRKAKVEALRQGLIYRLNRYAPKTPLEGPIRLTAIIYFDIKDRKLWGKYKTTRPDGDNYLKAIKDAMTEAGFWIDDAQVCDERAVRIYAERGSIQIQVETLNEPGRLKT